MDRFVWAQLGAMGLEYREERESRGMNGNALTA
jgi:hypothetical protein